MIIFDYSSSDRFNESHAFSNARFAARFTDLLDEPIYTEMISPSSTYQRTSPAREREKKGKKKWK